MQSRKDGRGFFVAVTRLILEWLYLLHDQLTLRDSDIRMNKLKDLEGDKSEQCCTVVSTTNAQAYPRGHTDL